MEASILTRGTGREHGVGVLFAPLVLPSLFVVHKTFGIWAVLAYVCGAGMLVAAFPRMPAPSTRRQELVAAIVLLALLVVVFLALFPLANVHLPMRGSDDDDAYDAGVRALLAGRSPYGQRTYLGNVLHQLPGAFIVAMPFVLMGTSAIQSLFWIPIFFAAIRVDAGNGRWVRLAVLVLVASPILLHQVATGMGHIANTLYVLLGLWWLIRTRHVDVAAVCWGVALASRANFLFLLPLAFGWLRQKRGIKAAARATGLAAATAAILVLPFYLANPSGFAPLEAARRLTRFDAILPYTGAVLLASMGLLSVLLAGRTMTREQLFTSCAIVQAFPVAAGTALSLAAWQTIDLYFLAYWTFSSWFSFMAWAEVDRARASGSTVTPTSEMSDSPRRWTRRTAVTP